MPTPVNPTADIPLEVWAEKKNKPHRTVKNWAREKKIPAKLKWTFTTVTITRRVRKYFISPDATVPGDVN